MGKFGYFFPKFEVSVGRGTGKHFSIFSGQRYSPLKYDANA